VFSGSRPVTDSVVSPGYHIISTAEAIVGRPLTPISYAGVARDAQCDVVGNLEPRGQRPRPVVGEPSVRSPRSINDEGAAILS